VHETTLAHPWQEINARRHFCHSWQDLHERMIAAMTVLLLLIVLAVAFAGLADWARHDVLSPARRPDPFC
jgi:hypothetical protein